MFTGIISEVGIIDSKKNSVKSIKFAIATKKILKDRKIGDSIAVDGVCVTITKIEKEKFHFDVMKETTKRTTFSQFKKGDPINLESPLKLGDSLDGHIVQGHVDTTGKVESIENQNDKTRIEIGFPEEIAPFIAFKGSITLNGVSLTISDLKAKSFKVDLIPHTLERTNLSKLKKDEIVNLEVDTIARYLKRLLDSKEKEAKYEFLKERNLL